MHSQIYNLQLHQFPEILDDSWEKKPHDQRDMEMSLLGFFISSITDPEKQALKPYFKPTYK